MFEINIRFVGGLLSLYALTKDEVGICHHTWISVMMILTSVGIQS